MAGKAYASKKQKKDRPIGDFYSTPKSLIWCIEHVIEQEFDKNKTILEPCFGEGAISDELRRMGFTVYENDLHKGGTDYLSKSFKQNQVITNPPFSMWDEFVVKAKKESDKVLMIGRLNYFGTNSRFNSDIWDNLKAVYCFNRYVDYRTETRQDGKFNVGAMATAWFLWDKNYLGKPELNFIDVQPYATLGNFKFEEV